MKIYNYMFDTKEFLYEEQALKNPLEKNAFLIPANATKIKPLPKKEGFALCFNEEQQKWEYLEDNRKKTAYEKTSKKEIEIDYLGSLKEEHTFLKPEKNSIWDEKTKNWLIDIKKLKEEKINEINFECEKAITSNFKSQALKEEHFYQSCKEDQINLMGLVTENKDNLLKCAVIQGENFIWKWKPHTASQLKKVFGDGVLHKKEQLLKAATLKAKILHLENADELKAISWTS